MSLFHSTKYNAAFSNGFNVCVTIIQSSILLHNEINSHLFFVVGNSGEL